MKKNIILFLCIFTTHYCLYSHSFLKLSPLVLQTTSTPKTLTMHTAVIHALHYRPDIEAVSFDIQANKSAAKAEIAGYFPTITLDSTLSQETGQKSLTNATFLGVNQLIYSFAGPQIRYARAKHVTNLSELEKTIQSNVIQLATEKAFLQAWLVQKQKEVIASLKHSSTSTFNFQKHSYSLGLLDKNVWLKNAEDYGSAIVQTEQYQDTALSAFTTLTLLTGQRITPQSTTLTWMYKEQHDLQALDHYTDLALKTRPEIKQGSHRIEIEQQNRKLAFGGRLPTINAFAQAGRSKGVILNTSHDFHTFGVSFSWLLFDGTVFHHQEQQARAQKIRQMLLREQTMLTIKQEVQEKYYVLSKAITQLNAQKLNYLRNQNEFTLKKQQRDIQLISDIDLDQAETTWEQAQLDWLARNVDVALAERDLYFACGYPHDLV